MNKKLDRVIFQNKIVLNTKYGSPIKQETEESCCKKFREVKHEAVKEFAEKLKKKLFECFQDNEGLDEKISVVTLYVDITMLPTTAGRLYFHSSFPMLLCSSSDSLFSFMRYHY